MKKSILLLFYLCITIAINAQSIGGNVLGVSFTQVSDLDDELK